jgi:hypothetical protein
MLVKEGEEEEERLPPEVPPKSMVALEFAQVGKGILLAHLRHSW